MDKSPVPHAAEYVATPEEDRRELQAILGQLHGLLSKAMEHGDRWCPTDLHDSIAVAYRDLGGAFGVVHAELNTGIYDSKLAGLGLAGEQMAPKKKGFWHALRRFFDPTKRGHPPLFGALGTATRWGGIIVGSLAKEVPGGEVIKEFIEVVQAAREQFKEAKEADEPIPPASRQTRKPEIG